MSKRLRIIGVLTLLSVGVASAQTPTPDALTAARDLVDTLKLSDQFKALLPGILLGIKPVLAQDRPEMERDFDAMAPKIVEAYAPHLKAMVDAAAKVYVNNFTVDELREMDAFYHRPAGQKLLQVSQAIAQQIDQIGRDGTRKAAEDLRMRLAELLRQKGK